MFISIGNLLTTEFSEGFYYNFRSVFEKERKAAGSSRLEEFQIFWIKHLTFVIFFGNAALENEVGIRRCRPRCRPVNLRGRQIFADLNLVLLRR